MSLLCHLYLHDFRHIDLGCAFGVALECRRCRYQVRTRSIPRDDRSPANAIENRSRRA